MTDDAIANNGAIGNFASHHGGGIYNRTIGTSIAYVIVTTSTLSGNSTGTGDGHGGGIYNDGSFVTSGQAVLEIGNTILNNGTYGENIYSFGSVAFVISRGYNLSSDAAGGDGATGPGGLLNATGDIRNTNPMLGPLQNNGGPTFTHALQPSTPAINMGDPNFTPPPDYDQRGPGYNRVSNEGVE